MKSYLLKALNALLCFAWLMNVMGTTGYLLYYHQYLFAVISLAVTVLAYPQVKKRFYTLLNY